LGVKYSDEDLMSYALFPQVALEFFARRDRAERPREELAALAAAIAGLLGVDKEATCGPQPAEAAAATPGPGAGAAGDPGASPEPAGFTESAAAGSNSGSAWAAAGRAELVGARAVAWRY